MREFYKALYMSERKIKGNIALDFFRGIKKNNAWKKLSGFSKSDINFKLKLDYEKRKYIDFTILVGQEQPFPSEPSQLNWVRDAIATEEKANTKSYIKKYSALKHYFDRGLIRPYLNQIARSIEKIKRQTKANDTDINIGLSSQLQNLEQVVRRAVVLELNIQSIKNNLNGENESQKFQNFTEQFSSIDNRLNFHKKYPVLYRSIYNKLDLWANAYIEFLERLKKDRLELQQTFGISINAEIKDISPSGDTHNLGRSVMVIDFSDGNSIVYKPRSVSIESGFQKYLKFINSIVTDLELRTIKVVDKEDYGWVEYVHFAHQTNEKESDQYHYKLGFLTSIIYSINGVDIFHENLISAGQDPVIIDLETMFHTSIDSELMGSPTQSLQSFLHESITGIGILPQPGVGSTETEVFDISVIGAKKNLKAPYKVLGIENFGRVDMRITEVPGWIPENKSSSENEFTYKTKAIKIFEGIKSGLNFIQANKEIIIKEGGVLDECFSGCTRRLIVRDTKDYGGLQQDENHPDLLRDQLDREWHFDNLWAATIERPALLSFIKSELSQIKHGDIPYFHGTINSCEVIGGDGTIIDIKNHIKETPLTKVKTKLYELNLNECNDQLRIAATTLGLDQLIGVTQPALDENKDSFENALIAAEFILKRIKNFDNYSWLDTSFNPAPAAKDIDAVRVVPCDPYLYDGTMGIVLLFHDLWLATKNKFYLDQSLRLTKSALIEVNESNNHSLSGYTGLASVVYVVNKCLVRSNEFNIFEPQLKAIINQINEQIINEEKLDFLLGISGISTAILPYVIRTSNEAGISIISKVRKKLIEKAEILSSAENPISGMNYIRGFSHGISGIAYGLYRIGEYYNDQICFNYSKKLLVHESELTKSERWTDEHMQGDSALVGWCHGSAGIALAISSMPSHLTEENILKYYDDAVANTLKKGVYKSKCLCHGSSGNLFCIAAESKKVDKFNEVFNVIEKDFTKQGFSSNCSAQNMSIGLMTGLAGGAYFLMHKKFPNLNPDFLTLS
ncbi:MAG: type 2 lantipeptide synthetase LanM [Pseudomonadota bacterium]|jgi:type 2 lantibiotic biosynthesis protein LanM